ncbi:hypothetical protein PSHT_07698 [Puccinia striiformis]|uniref:protein-tyrosine-phosphatase n=1 Tax=Puccinia striiformis TaxID=27350 RepID=A0A2S4VV94_9BASI|nr:hypothetical protein PSHT_07698 [Puccinia striiformis]
MESSQRQSEKSETETVCCYVCHRRAGGGATASGSRSGHFSALQREPDDADGWFQAVVSRSRHLLILPRLLRSATESPLLLSSHHPQVAFPIMTTLSDPKLTVAMYSAIYGPASLYIRAVTTSSGEQGPSIQQDPALHPSDDDLVLPHIGYAQGSDHDDAFLEQVPMDTFSPTCGYSFASSRYIRTSPPHTPSPHPRRISNATQGNRIYQPIPSSHQVSNLTAMPSTPHYMDISPAPVDRRAHYINEPARVPSETQPLCEDSAKRLIPRENHRHHQDGPGNSPMLEASVGDMDIDSPGYNLHALANHLEPAVQSSSASPFARAPPFKQHPGRSVSEGSIGKRSRVDEDGGYQCSIASPTSSRRSCRRQLSHPSLSNNAAFSPLPQPSGILFARSDLNKHQFSPEPLSSSSMEDTSPCLNAVARKAVYQAPHESPLPGFRFPATESICDKPSSISDTVPHRSKSKIAQNGAKSFNRQHSLSTTLEVTRFEETTLNARGLKIPRPLSFTAGDTIHSPVCEGQNSEEPDDCYEFDLSPVPQILVKPISASKPILKGKRCAAPLTLNYLQPPALNSPTALLSPRSRFTFQYGATIQSPVGVAFSEKERAGKILPCHKVSSDGLMRISPETMDKLLEGLYEYDGGHIREAINFDDKETAESMLLQGGLFEGGDRDVPIPSESGKPDPNGETKKVVLVFHCEYSAMRAPTVAKHVREQDRHKNMTYYPALHYPEVYILEGGFARYFAHSPQHCDGDYVRMDDPTHRSDRHADLSLFRTRENAGFTRTKSYAYGESETHKQRKDPKLTLGPSRLGLGQKSFSSYCVVDENTPTRSKTFEDDDDYDIYAQASSPLYMTNAAAINARRANLKTQGRSIGTTQDESSQSTGGVEGRKLFGSNKTLLNRLALA